MHQINTIKVDTEQQTCRQHLKNLPLSWAGACVLARKRLLSHRTTGQGGIQPWSRAVVLRRTLQTSVYGHSSNSWPICPLRTGDWTEAAQRTVET